MTQRRSYPRNMFERHGISQTRPLDPYFDIGPPIDKQENRPDCILISTKLKNNALAEQVDSQLIKTNSLPFMLQAFPAAKYYRYKVNVYLKKQS